MNSKTSKLLCGARALLLAALPLIVNQALAAEYWLQTGTTTVQGVPMWGYALCGSGATAPTACAGAVTVPGPALTVPPGEGLIVHLKNNLPEPTSLVIPGQTNTMTPVWVEPAMVKGIFNPLAGTTYTTGTRPALNLTAVVRSFTTETAPTASGVYTWTAIKPGTYLYQSGTHPQVQVQMGLYGAMTKDAGAGKVAYSQGTTNVAYSNQVTLLYSEIDPALHAAVAGGSYGTTGLTSTLEYHPKYFLINGQPYDATLNPGPVATVPAGQNTLLRFLNASLKTHVPTINGQHWKMIAEDGNPYPYLNNPRQQYTAFLAAGKTMDVLLAPANASTTANARYAIFDSRHFDTNNGTQGGGMLAYLDVTPAAAAAPVFDSAPVTAGTVGVAYAYAAHATDPNGDTVVYSLNAPVQAGMTIAASTGLISWTPSAAGTYPVSVRASDTTAPTPLFSDQLFNIVVAPVIAPNNPPTARNDSYTAVAHPASSGLTQAVAAPGVLANDTDPDSNPLTAVNKTGSSRVTLNANGSFTLAPAGTGGGTTGTVSFGYQARDNSGAANNTSAAATVTINVVANRRPTTVADAFTVPRCTTGSGTTCSGAYVPLALNLVNNDTDPDTLTIDVANQLPLAVARVRAQTSGNNTGSTSAINTAIGGRVTISGGTVTYRPVRNFAGTDVFQYRVKDKLGLESSANNDQGWATVTVTVQ